MYTKIKNAIITLKNKIKEMDWKTVLYLSLLVGAVFSIVFHLVVHAIAERIPFHFPEEVSGNGIYIAAILVISWFLSRSLKKAHIAVFAGTTFAYLLISYGLYITRNINNEAFRPFDFSKNHFWELDSLPTLLLIFSIAAFFRYVFDQKSVVSIPHFSDYGLGFLVPILVFSDSKLLRMITNSAKESVKEMSMDHYLEKLLPDILLATLGILILSILFLMAIRQIRQNKAGFSLAVMTSFLMALIINYPLQLAVQEDAKLLDRFIFEGATLYQILFFAILYLLVYAIINRYLLTTLSLVSLSTILVIANFLKVSMRSEPLLITDLVWAHDIRLVLSFVDKQYAYYLVGIAGLLIGVYLLLRKRIFVSLIFERKRYRLVTITSLVVIILSVFSAFRGEKEGKIVSHIPVISTLNNWNDIEWFGFSVNARYKSLAYVWTKQLAKRIMEKPSGYNQEAIEALSERYRQLAQEINHVRTGQISNQTVIYILSESLADPNHIEGVTLSQEVLPYIQQLKTETTSGLMISDGYGGGTANMEFQSLTGLPFIHYSPSVSVLYTEVVPKMKVFPSISDQFMSENRLVLHPSGANNYNRKNIYQQLGFERLIFSSESDETFQNKERVGVSLGDRSVYQTILDNLDTSQDQFFSVITMQNHAPWSVGNPEEVTASGLDFTTDENDKLTEYARLLTHTDKATQEFIEALSHIDHPITVVFYGDHLPGFYPSEIFKNNSGVQYQTDYFIWSNYQSKKLDSFDWIRSNDFPAALLQHTDSKVSPYYALLTVLLNQGIIEGVDVDISIDEAVADLQMVQYDISLGQAYIKNSKDFFVIGE